MYIRHDLKQHFFRNYLQLEIVLYGISEVIYIYDFYLCWVVDISTSGVFMCCFSTLFLLCHV